MKEFNPNNITQEGGRWYYEGTDVTNMLVWWKCPLGHEWQATIGERVDGGGNCPECTKEAE